MGFTAFLASLWLSVAIMQLLPDQRSQNTKLLDWPLGFKWGVEAYNVSWTKKLSYLSDKFQLVSGNFLRLQLKLQLRHLEADARQGKNY